MDQLIVNDLGHINMLKTFTFDRAKFASGILPVPHVERLLLIAGSDDLSLPAVENAVLLASRSSSLSHVEVCIYPQAGHLIEPPSPHCDAAFNALFGGAIVLFGGENVKQHALAKRASFEQLIRFFVGIKAML